MQSTTYTFTKTLRKAVREDFAIGQKLYARTYYVRSPNTQLFEGPYTLDPSFSDLVLFGKYLKDGVVWVDTEVKS